MKVVYIGGSITEGAFSSVPEKNYVSLLTSWLGTFYREVQSRNFGVGGTTSEFGAYRINHDLAGFTPDVAFIEFAVNDAGTKRPELFAHIDAIIYKLRQANPQVRVYYISTTDVGEEAARRAGGRAFWIEDMAAAASFEGVPFIDATTGFWARVIAGTAPSTFMTDSVHPNDAGHQLYFEAIRDALASSVPFGGQPTVSQTRLIADSKLDTARLEKGSSASGCRAGTLPLKYMDNALICTEGETFTYQFTGTTVGLLRATVRDGGRAICTIDGGNPVAVDFYDESTHIYERPFPAFLYHGLPSGQHTLSCRVTSDIVSIPQGASTGHRAPIGYFMVSDERQVNL